MKRLIYLVMACVLLSPVLASAETYVSSPDIVVTNTMTDEGSGMGRMKYSLDNEWLGEIAVTTRFSLFEKSIGIMTGLGLGFSLHESAHRLQAEIEGVEVSNESLTSMKFNGNNREERNIALAGFIPGIIGSEIILGVDAIPKDNSIIIGYMLWNILHPISYIIRHEIIYDDGYGDLKVIDDSGWDSRYVEAGLLAHSLLSAYRLYSHKEVPVFVKATHNEVMVSLGWKF